MSSQTSLLSPSVSHQYPNGDSVKCLVIDTDPNKKRYEIYMGGLLVLCAFSMTFWCFCVVCECFLCVFSMSLHILFFFTFLTLLSDRPEWALLHYDTSFHPQHAYHFQLHWLVCTGRLLDELLQTWSRRANQLGLSLIEVPITPGYLQSDDTLLSSVTVPLAVPPHTLASLNLDDTFSDLPPTYFEDALLRQFNFVFSVGPTDAAAAARPGSNVLAHKYPQYIHRTGFAIVYILDGGRGFIWENNRLLCSRCEHIFFGVFMGVFLIGFVSFGYVWFIIVYSLVIPSPFLIFPAQFSAFANDHSKSTKLQLPRHARRVHRVLRKRRRAPPLLERRAQPPSRPSRP